MCTLTLIRLPGDGQRAGYRLATNRDEQRTRTPARPPARHVCGARQALFPVDPGAEGTWVGVNDRALTIALLNVYPVEASRMVLPAPEVRLSRGRVVRDLLALPDSAAALAAAWRLDLDRYPPFCVVATDRRDLRWLRWDGVAVGDGGVPLAQAPFLFVSSGLGDEAVERPRRELFETVLANADLAEQAAMQDALHRHVWPERPEISVCMRRSDACTVSLTTIAVSAEQATLTYHDAAPDEPASPMILRLPLTEAEGADS